MKANAFALSLVDAASVSFSWVTRKAPALARSTAKLFSIGLSWSRVKANAFALSLSFSWIVAKARDLASSLPKLVSATRLQARRYRRRGLALAGALSERARAGIQGFHLDTAVMDSSRCESDGVLDLQPPRRPSDQRRGLIRVDGLHHLEP